VKDTPCYRLFGLTVRSQCALAGVAPAGDGDAVDVEVRLGRITEPEAGPGYSALPQAALLTVPEVGRYLIREGREITIEPLPGCNERGVQLFLLGSAFGALLHQRGLMPLHANAIDIGGRAVAFTGHSGAGKSTIAAWFNDRGYTVLSDDVCVISFDPSGRALAQPGLRRLRLWNDALQATGRHAGDFHRSFDDRDGRDKYDVPTDEERAAVAVPLAAVYLLGTAPDDASTGQIDRLIGVEAIDALVSNTYRGQFVTMIGGTAPHLATCIQVARRVPVFRAERVWGHEQFEAQARLLEAHALSLPDS
jgi:hypothetical protein